jgi:hypothetical protein
MPRFGGFVWEFLLSGVNRSLLTKTYPHRLDTDLPMEVPPDGYEVRTNRDRSRDSCAERNEVRREHSASSCFSEAHPCRIRLADADLIKP